MVKNIALAVLMMAPVLLRADMLQSSNDDRQIKHFKLANGVKVLVISDVSAEKSAAALSVAVGSYQDFDDRPGLAHFLEHMLFQGTTKFPESDAYFSYIKKHGGMANAFTSMRHTQYYFDITPKAYAGALERFSEFFISPLFDATQIDKERHAVENEFNLRLKNDQVRAYNAIKQTINPQHPFRKFGCGNIETLGDAPERADIRQSLIKFYKDYYTPERMVLVLVGPQSAEQLKLWAEKYFAPIAPREVKPTNINEAFYVSPTKRDVYYKSLKDESELELIYLIPNQSKDFKYAAIEYLSHLFKQTAKGSLYAHLHKHNWISDIDIGISDIDANQELFSLNFKLTDLGKKHIDDITQLTFNYIEFIKQHGVKEDLFADLVAAGERDFYYAPKENALSLVSKYTPLLHDYPPEHVLALYYVTKSNEFNSGKITQLLGFLREDNMLRFIVDNKAKTDAVEKWYKAEYAVKERKPAQRKKLNSKLDVDFKLPATNKFNPQDFSLRPTSAATAIPENIYNDALVKLWFQQDTKFLLPRQHLSLMVRTADNNVSPERQLAQVILSKALKENLLPYSSDFTLAGINAGFYPMEEFKGLTLNIAMYSDKTQDVLQIALDTLQKVELKADKFAIYKADLVKSLANHKHESLYIQGIKRLRQAIFTPSFSIDQKLKAARKLTRSDIIKEWQKMLASFNLEMLAYGNISKDEATHYAKFISEKLQPQNILPRNEQEKGLQLQELTRATAQEIQLDTKHHDALLTRYYQPALTGKQAIAQNMLTKTMLSAPLFEQLRTQEQLGYIILNDTLTHKHQPGAIVLVESSTHASAKLDKSLSNFLAKFAKDLPKTSLANFKEHQAGVINNLREKPKTMLAQFQAFNYKIEDDSYDFTFDEDVADKVAALTIEEVSDYFNSLFLAKDSASVSVEYTPAELLEK